MRSIRLARLLLLGAVALAAAAPVRGEPPAPADIAALIDRLTEVSSGDVGYSASASGTAFLPLDAHGKIQVTLLGRQPLAPSDTLRQLVKRGVAALPLLLAHLDDKRLTGVTIDPRGFMNCTYSDYLDRNERSDKPVPTPEREGTIAFMKDPYTVTVGDLCFVAIGQIVNRSYDTASYFPTASAFITSMAHSPALRQAVRQAWAALTPERHRAGLVAEFLKPDHPDRRIGACKRLAYY
jgi:hypothetical protein